MNSSCQRVEHMKWSLRPRTIVTRQTINSSAVELGDNLTRSLRAQARSVGVVIHERDLLGRLVRRVEVVLQGCE
jgi:hypothetical protein